MATTKPPATPAPSAASVGKMRRAQQAKLKVVKLEVIGAIQLIVADMDEATKTELAASLESCAQKLHGVVRFLNGDIPK